MRSERPTITDRTPITGPVLLLSSSCPSFYAPPDPVAPAARPPSLPDAPVLPSPPVSVPPPRPPTSANPALPAAAPVPPSVSRARSSALPPPPSPSPSPGASAPPPPSLLPPADTFDVHASNTRLPGPASDARERSVTKYPSRASAALRARTKTSLSPPPVVRIELSGPVPVAIYAAAASRVAYRSVKATATCPRAAPKLAPEISGAVCVCV